MPDSNRNHCRRRPFSLMEIMVVLLIIGMTVALVIPNVIGRFGKAQRQTAKSQILLLRDAVDTYYLDMSEYPERFEDLIRDPGNDRWDGPYLRDGMLPKDPWGEEYQYELAAGDWDFNITSTGADRAPGGSGRGADISLHTDE